MKWLNGNRTSLVVVGIVAAMVLSGGPTKADFTFGEPENLGPAFNSPADDFFDCFSADGLELYLDSNRSGTYGGWDIWVFTRETLNDEWGTPVHLGPPVNTGQPDCAASISADGLELYFCSYNRPGGYGDWDIWVTRRVSRDNPWGQAVNLGAKVNSSTKDSCPRISSNGMELYFASARPGGYGSDDLWMASRATKNDPWESPVNLGPVVNSPASECIPYLSDNGLLLFFSEDLPNRPLRPGGFGNIDIWLTRRESVSAPWGAPVNLGPTINTASIDSSVVISPDGSTLHFTSGRPGGFGGTYGWGDIYQAPITPVIDLNGDGIVDADDMCSMIEHWGESYSLFDIGPAPIGDGIVDVEDLIVLAEHLFEDVNDSTLIAHWAFDETEGILAHASDAYYDGVLFGGPVWQPEGGIVAGAIHLDGVDDYVVTGFAPKPDMGAYSVLAWIQGGAPGQVILSQMGKANWFGTDPSGGFLMTELTVSGRDSRSLGSEAVITDGNWHRIAFVWDGSKRRLYVDGVVVAEDVQDNLDISVNGLYFGTGKTMESGTFWAGLIDDVRIYNRAVSP